MSAEDMTATPAPVAGASSSGSYKHYVLAILTLVYVVNYLDRQILNILLPMIKKAFVLSDFDLGLLSGTAFAFVYATLGIPLAIFADRMNRRNIIAGSLALFSLMTVFCGLAVQFWQLVLARLGTGVGEAGTGPSINSVISDYYPPQRRATALSFYSAGLNVGLIVGFFGGGWVAQNYGWRDAFYAAGAPGLLLTFIVLFTVREPVRGATDRMVDTRPAPSFWDVVKHLISRPSFRWLSVGCGLTAFSGYTVLIFLPLFLTISHHMTPIQIGVTLALLTGGAGAIGTFLAGYIADHFGKKDMRALIWVPMFGTLAAIPFAPIVYLVPSTPIAIAAGIVPALMGAVYVGPGLAVTQALVPVRMRAQSVALFLFILNVIGLGVGPPLIGRISDLLRPSLGNDSLRWAMMFTLFAAAAAIVCYWRATKTLRADMAKGSVPA